MTSSGVPLTSSGIPIGPPGNLFTVFQVGYWKIQLLFMENHAWRVETGWTCSGGTPTSSDICTEIWWDEAGAAVKDGAAIVITSSGFSRVSSWGSIGVLMSWWEMNFNNSSQGCWFQNLQALEGMQHFLLHNLGVQDGTASVSGLCQGCRAFWVVPFPLCSSICMKRWGFAWPMELCDSCHCCFYVNWNNFIIYYNINFVSKQWIPFH